MMLALEAIDSLTVTTLVDNFIDTLAFDHGPAKRSPMANAALPRIAAPLLEPGQTVDALRAEHGFSALVTITKGDQERRILFDAGMTPDGLIENMRRLELSPGDIEVIVLSHGHFDHTTGIDGLVKELGRVNVPVFIHPEFWTQRRVAIPGVDPIELPSTSKSALEGAGFTIIEEQQPSFLFDGSLLVTGEIDRTTDFEQGFLVHQALRNGQWEADPLILDDQALVANLRGKGLIILTGCGHSGLINILRHLTKLTDESHVHAVIGGFHLSGPLFEPLIEPTCEALKSFAPDYVVPSHCSGWKAAHALATSFPEAFIQNTVGTRFEFAST